MFAHILCPSSGSCSTGSAAVIKHIRTWIKCRSFLCLLLMHDKWIYMYLHNMNMIHGSLKFLWTYLNCQSSSISLPLLDPSLWSPPPSCDASPPSSSLSLSTILAFFFLGPFSSSESYKGKRQYRTFILFVLNNTKIINIYIYMFYILIL